MDVRLDHSGATVSPGACLPMARIHAFGVKPTKTGRRDVLTGVFGSNDVRVRALSPLAAAGVVRPLFA
jgi:hypothetical protein